VPGSAPLGVFPHLFVEPSAKPGHHDPD
jgi:hypothetical protein